MIEESLAYREQVVAEAQGETRRFEALLTEYQKAPEVTPAAALPGFRFNRS